MHVYILDHNVKYITVGYCQKNLKTNIKRNFHNMHKKTCKKTSPLLILTLWQCSKTASKASSFPGKKLTWIHYVRMPSSGKYKNFKNTFYKYLICVLPLSYFYIHHSRNTQQLTVIRLFFITSVFLHLNTAYTRRM